MRDGRAMVANVLGYPFIRSIRNDTPGDAVVFDGLFETTER